LEELLTLSVIAVNDLVGSPEDIKGSVVQRYKQQEGTKNFFTKWNSKAIPSLCK